MYDASMDLILFLQLQGIYELPEEHVYEAAEDAVPNLLLAVELFRVELRTNANVIDNHRFAATIAEAIEVEGFPVSLDPSATPLFDEAFEQHIPETIAPYEAISEDYVPSPNATIVECMVCARKEEEIPHENTMW